VSDRGFAFANRPSENLIGRLGNMPEKPRLGTPVVLLLLFGESFRTAMDGTIVQRDLKIRIILIHITDARRADYINCATHK
jgi:hypothetical protein